MTLRKSAPGQVGRGRLSLSKKSFRQAEARRYGGAYPLPSVARREKRGFSPPLFTLFPPLDRQTLLWGEFFYSLGGPVIGSSFLCLYLL